ncbi:sensor histidine kinase [Winogradskya humida]|uniref:histidine kinase n=1 Tax=Winogradskya humida TaxID=113566 RepID=A0ABQ3ZHV9_9ACTN|nr:histidine kinase [Actinoplanes humidus]GIE18181.1 hypothetical protein Ahu01nite_012830 [Actinoplanes humidus]
MNTLKAAWPLGALLIVTFALDLESGSGLELVRLWWTTPGVALLAAAALTAPWRPLLAGAGAIAVLAGWSLVARIAGGELMPVLGPLSMTEVVALMAVIAAVVRLLAPGTAAAVVAGLLAGCVVAQVLRPSHLTPDPDPLRNLVVPAALALGLAVGAGWYLRGRDAARDRATGAAVAAAQQRERLNLARELHDVVAHHVGGMVVQAQAAQAVAGRDAGAAGRVLPLIEGAGAEALSAMRRMVTVLRDAEPAGAPAPVRTADLAADLRAVTTAPAQGIPIRLRVALSEPVPGEVSASVLRLVQESVTNARRYATGAGQIVVEVRTGPGTVRVRVTDDGRPAAGPERHGGGFGLIGMRERVHLLGGSFSAGRLTDRGWQVSAEVPLRTGEK